MGSAGAGRLPFGGRAGSLLVGGPLEISSAAGFRCVPSSRASSSCARDGTVADEWESNRLWLLMAAERRILGSDDSAPRDG
jgi:hypothetical protein